MTVRTRTAVAAAALACALFSGPGGTATAGEAAEVVQTSDGVASWYGGKFHGRKTANGERFDKNALTAAHRSLPFGTRVRVTNARSGEAVVVRINDRGPYAGERIIDLSRGAAAQIGIVGAGVGQVELEILRSS